MSEKELTAEWHWKDEWGTGFTKATLSEKDGLLEMSMDDIYNTMQSFAEHYHEINSKGIIEKYRVNIEAYEGRTEALKARIRELEEENASLRDLLFYAHNHRKNQLEDWVIEKIEAQIAKIKN